jgi:Protein of unknown function (DUF3810)
MKSLFLKDIERGFFMKKNISFYLCLFLPIQIIGSYFLSQNTTFIERFYVPYVFKNLRTFWATITSNFSFSIGLILVPFLLLALFYSLFKKFKTPQSSPWQQLFASISILYFVYLLHWGFLYNRTPLPDLLGFEKSETSVADLDSLCHELVLKTNEKRSKISDNQLLDTNFEQVFEKSKAAYQQYYITNSLFGLANPNLKKAAGSTFLSYLSTAGIYNFLSAEANVNTNSLSFELPFIATHELAHQAGFASEDEANYIAYITCKNSSDPIFQYSANYGVVFRAINLLGLKDSTAAKSYASKLNNQVRADRMREKTEWEKYRNPFQKYIAGPFYDLFLKSNGEIDGANSYDKVIDLILAEKRKSKS